MFREGGQPHQLVVLTDLRLALREEEREAWRRLVRVLSHEINNSLTPIHSIADALKDLVAQVPRPADWEEDTRPGPGGHREPLRALLHHQTAGQWHWPGAQPTDCGGARRQSAIGEPHRRARLPRPAQAPAGRSARVKPGLVDSSGSGAGATSW